MARVRRPIPVEYEYSAEELAIIAESDAFYARMEIVSAARRRYSEVLARCQAVQDQFPRLYILDEQVSFENAAEGLLQNEGIVMVYGDLCEQGYDALARNIENDCGVRMVELGLDPSAHGIRY